tara:strand:+ start:1482 stop:3500 length:2019 start_codon:yes stop_codon:yes gene_type:complete
MAINKKLGAATGVAGVGALGATTSAAATNSTVALASNLMTKLGYGTANTVGGSGSMLAAANPAVAGAVAALPLVMGLTGMPSGKANIAKLKKAKQDRKMAPIMEKLNSIPNNKPASMSDDEYLQSQSPPPNPAEIAQQNIMQGDQGDKDYEIDQAEQYNNSPQGKAEFESWRQTGDNSLWYNEDRTRTDYAGPYAPPLSEQRATAEATFGPLISAPAAQTTDDSGNEVVTTDPVATIPGQSVKLADGTKFNYAPQVVSKGELGTTDGKLLDEGVRVSTENIKISTAVLKDMGVPDVNKVSPLPTLEAITAEMTDENLIAEVTSELSERYLKAEEEAKASVENFEAFYGSSVKEQFAILQDDWTGMDGKSKIPFYARGAITAANQAMAARGMGGSSMAAAAITQAGLESMMPVAMADAQFMQTLSVKAFDAKTAMGVAKLSHIAMLDVEDLNFAQSRAVDSANKFFQMNMDNVAAERVVAATNNANEVQKLFTDTAAINVANNLSFTTEAEMTRFYDELAFQAADSTARLTLDADKFNASVKNARSQFNASMSLEIEKDNINYLRSVNTANTAGINQQNMINSQNLLNISNTQIANALTLQRDQLQKIFEASENASDRSNNYAIASLNQSGAMDRLSASQKHESAQNLGGFFSDVGNNLFSAWQTSEYSTAWL